MQGAGIPPRLKRRGNLLPGDLVNEYSELLVNSQVAVSCQLSVLSFQ